MAKVFKILKSWMRQYDCSFAICHHQRKPGTKADSSSFSYRGSSESKAFADSMLEVRRDLTRQHGMTVEHVKSRYDKPIKNFSVEIVDDADGGASVRYAGDALAEKDSKTAMAESFLRIFLSDGQGHKRDELIEAAKEQGVPRDTVDMVRKDLVTKGVLQQDREGHALVVRLVSKTSDGPEGLESGKGDGRNEGKDPDASGDHRSPNEDEILW